MLQPEPKSSFPRDSGRRRPGPFTAPSWPRPFPVHGCAQPQRGPGQFHAGIQAPAQLPICATRSPSVVSPWSPGGSGRAPRITAETEVSRSSGSCGCMKWGPVQAGRARHLAGSLESYLLSYILTLVCCRFRIISTSASCLKCSHQAMAVPRDVWSGTTVVCQNPQTASTDEHVFSVFLILVKILNCEDFSPVCKKLFLITLYLLASVHRNVNISRICLLSSLKQMPLRPYLSHRKLLS